MNPISAVITVTEETIKATKEYAAFLDEFCAAMTKAREELERMIARIAELERDDSDGEYTLAEKCSNCGAPLITYRPGDSRCSAECYIKDGDRVITTTITSEPVQAANLPEEMY